MKNVLSFNVENSSDLSVLFEINSHFNRRTDSSMAITDRSGAILYDNNSEAFVGVAKDNEKVIISIGGDNPEVVINTYNIIKGLF